MSEDEDRSQSADEIVENMADEMGVRDAEVSDSDISDEMMDDLGGLFGVSSEDDAKDAPSEDRSGVPESDATAVEAGAKERESDNPDREQTVEMSKDVSEAIANSEDLDDETREKLQQVLDEKESEDSADGEGEEASPEEEEAGDSEQEAAGSDSGGEDSGAEEAEDEDAEAEQAEAEDAEAEQAEAEEADEGSEQEVEAEESSSDDESASDDRVGGVFSPSGGDDFDEDDLDDAYLGEDDLGDYDGDDGLSQTVMMVGGGGLLVLGLVIAGLFLFTNQGERLVHLFKGDLKEYEMAQSKNQHDKLVEKQRELVKKAPKVGKLSLTGTPKYAEIRIDGKRPYAQTKESKEWRAVQLTPKTQLRVWNIQTSHKVTVSAPGFKKKEWELSEGMWKAIGSSVPDLDDAALKYQKRLRVSLSPKGETMDEQKARQTEFQKRMETNPDDSHYGKVTLKSKPSGAKIIFDGKPLLDEEGEELKTPVSFEKAYYKNEETGEVDEKKVKVDMPPDRGHKIQMRLPEEKGEYPKIVSNLERQMWTCNWKDGEKPDEPGPKKCNYTFNMNVDFEAVKSYIEGQKKNKKETKKAWKKTREKMNALADKYSKDDKKKKGKK